MRRVKLSVGVMALSLGLTACQTTGSVATKQVPCITLKPIAWSRNDTRETQDQATEYNAVAAAMCGWKRKGDE